MVRMLLLSLLLSAGAVATVAAQEVRFLNGAPARGTIKAVSPEGMELELNGTAKTYPWSALSAGTRFRYDPVYRVNLAAVQAGQPPAGRTNAAESGYLVTPSAESGETGAAGSPMAPPPTLLQAGAGSGPLRFEAYAAVAPFARSGIPKLELRNADAALSWGVRYGQSARDIAYFVFDVKEPGELPESMIIHAVAENRTDRIKAARRGEGSDATAQFRKLRYQGAFGAAQAGIDLSCSFSAQNPSVLQLAAEVELTRGQEVCAFSLLGAPAGALQGAGDITPRELLVPPGLWMSIETAGGRAVAVGNLRMGRFKLQPRRGMDTAVAVTLLDESGQTVQAATAALNEANLQDRYLISLPLEKALAGRKYTLKASLNLGPLLGPVSYEEGVVLTENLGR